MYSHKLSDLIISYIKDPATNLSELIAWNSLYNSNDIKIINFDNEILEMYVYFKNKFHFLRLSFKTFINEIM